MHRLIVQSAACFALAKKVLLVYAVTGLGSNRRGCGFKTGCAWVYQRHKHGALISRLLRTQVTAACKMQGWSRAQCQTVGMMS